MEATVNTSVITNSHPVSNGIINSTLYNNFMNRRQAQISIPIINTTNQTVIQPSLQTITTVETNQKQTNHSSNINIQKLIPLYVVSGITGTITGLVTGMRIIMPRIFNKYNFIQKDKTLNQNLRRLFEIPRKERKPQWECIDKKCPGKKQIYLAGLAGAVLFMSLATIISRCKTKNNNKSQ